MRIVDKRQNGLTDEYAKKLHAKDQKWCGTAPGTTGPLEAKLSSFGRLRGLVFGTVGEVSEDVDKLVHALAHAGATARKGAAGTMSLDALRGYLIRHARKSIGITHWRGLATLLLDRRNAFTDGGAAEALRSASRGRNSASQTHQHQRAATQGRAAASGPPPRGE